MLAVFRPRGRLTFDAPLAPLTWFRTGGSADALFQPADEEDLAAFLAYCPKEIAVTVIGLGSNLIVRDGGLAGVAIRLGGKAFGAVAVDDDCRIVVGAAAPDAFVAKTAAPAGAGGFAFYRGIPGSIGGALRMNAGAHGAETKDVLVAARALDRSGALHVCDPARMGFSYRHCAVPDDFIFTAATFQGRREDPALILGEMARIGAEREASQPIREKTGGSTFANPPGRKAWRLIDEAGCRGLDIGDAQVSTMHCNFLINRGAASAADLETLGEEVRRRVLQTSGIALEWEIRRIGRAGREP